MLANDRGQLANSRSAFDQNLDASRGTAANDPSCDFLHRVDEPAVSIGRQLLNGFQSKRNDDDKNQ